MKFKSITISLTFLIFFLGISISFCDIIIRSPLELKNKFEKGVIKTGYATFGFNPYGYTLTGRVYFDPNNSDTDLACNYEKMKNIVTEKTHTIDNAPIVMLDRGKCHFVEKARNVQNAGGKVALIINSDDVNVEQIIMSDDGTASDIMIPLVLISKKDGEVLKDYYRKNKNNPIALKSIILDVDFQIEHSSNTAKVEIFMNSYSEEVYKLMSDLKKFKDLSKIFSFLFLFI